MNPSRNFLLDLVLILSCFFKPYLNFYISADNSNTTLENFSFGSCYKYDRRNNVFDVILKNQPQIWMWTGDIIYVRTVDEGRSHFKLTKEETYYSKLRESIPTIGVWDDHDYGRNDGNKYFKHKDIYVQLFLDFFDEPESSVRRTANRGIYTSYTFGDPSSHKTVKIILLDVRYHKDKAIQWREPDILGEEQWKWLENELSSNETFTFLVTGSQFLPNNRFVTESWYPYPRKRMVELLQKKGKSGIVFISGDIHSGQLLRTPCILPELGYHIYEITSSGLTHYVPFSNTLFDVILPNDYMTLPTITDYNFGFLQFFWGESRSESKFEIKLKNLQNNVLLQYQIGYNDLVFKRTEEDDESKQCSVRFNRRIKSLKDYLSYYRKKPIHSIVLLFYLAIILILAFLGWTGLTVGMFFLRIFCRWWSARKKVD